MLQWKDSVDRDLRDRDQEVFKVVRKDYKYAR